MRRVATQPLRRLPRHQRAAVQLHVEARAAGSRNPSPSWQRLEHHDAERSLLATVDFELVRGATVRLRVVDQHGAPVPAASAHMRVAGLDTDTANRVAASGIADADGFVHLSAASDGNETDLGDVVLRNVAVLQGRVHDEDGAPAAGVGFAIVRDDGERLQHCATVTTDAAGRVRYAATAMGRHWLRAVAAGANATSAAFHGPAAALVEAPGEAVLTLVGLRRIAVEVTDPAGEPFVGRDFTVDAWLPGVGPAASLAPAERAKTPPDDSGGHSVWPAGALWPVGGVLGIRCIAHAEQLSAAALVAVAEGPAVQTVALRLTVPSLGTVEVVWAGQDAGFDRELGDFEVALEPLRFGSADHMLDSDSLERTEQGFVVPCERGRYRLALTITASGYAPATVAVDVRAGAFRAVTVELVRQ